MKGSNEYETHRDGNAGSRAAQSIRTSRQLLLQGFEGNREPPPSRAATREARSRRGASSSQRRRPPRARTKPSRPREPGLLSVVEKMDLLVENAHLLRDSERAWVARIELSTKSVAKDRYLSDRQGQVITDIFDRFRTRLGG